MSESLVVGRPFEFGEVFLVSRRKGHGGLNVAVAVSVVGVGIVGMVRDRFGVRETMKGIDELFRRCHCCNG